MTLRVIEQAYRSDTGRQRSANEDSLFVRSPLFAVADGMGGAQAGEVASKIAAESFEPAQIDEAIAPETFLREIVLGANHRIHDLSQRDSSRSGMGTTLTAALLRGDELSLAHVGDSRAYLYRNGELRLLTSDHSLVEELRRQGRLTAQQAEEHPQRSIITRALGPEPEVEVDTMTYKAKAGDVYILCSDGLTTMIKEPAIAAIAAEATGLDQLATELVRAANDAGGRDNITVVTFKVAEAGDSAEAEDATLIGPTAERAGLTGEAVREGADLQRASSATASGSRSSGSGSRAAAAPPSKRRRGSRSVKVLALVVVLAAIVAAGVIGSRQVYFLGTDDGGRLSLYRGLPYDLPLGLDLYAKQYSIPILATSVPTKRRESVTNHELRSKDDAVSLLDDLKTAAEQVATKTPAKTTKTPEGASQNQGGTTTSTSTTQSGTQQGSSKGSNGGGSNKKGSNKTNSGGNGSSKP